MGKTNKERALNLLAVIDIRNNYALTQHGRTDDPAMSDTDVVERLLDKAERRGRRKAAAVFAENTALKAQIACLKYAPPFDDMEGYHSRGEPYDVELTRDGATVTARVWDIPESARGNHILINDCDDYAICCGGCAPCSKGCKVLYKNLYLQGLGHINADDPDHYWMPTVIEARDYFTHITALIDKLNEEYKPAPQFDAEEVKELIGNLMGSVYYKATINDWLTESQKRAAEIVENDKRELLAALGIE